MRVFSTSSTTLTEQALQQRDALAQRRLELDLAAHRALGDLGDMRPSARRSRQARRCIPGRSWWNPCRPEKASCAALRSAARQYRSAGRRAPRGGDRRWRGCRPCCLPAHRRGCRPRPRPTASAPASRRQHRARAVEDGRIERGIVGIADQRGDERHRVISKGPSKAVLIAGPTASGKSALALELAQMHGGMVINTDSMQVYRDLRVLTARPTPEEEALAPHRLYGHVDAAVNFSAGSLRRRRGEDAGGSARAKPRADLRRRQRALFQGDDARDCRRCRRFRRR